MGRIFTQEKPDTMLWNGGTEPVDFSAIRMNTSPSKTLPKVSLNQTSKQVPVGRIQKALSLNNSTRIDSAVDFSKVNVTRAPTSFVQEKAQQVAQAIPPAVSSFLQSEQQRQATQSIGEEAVTELVERPAQIERFLTVDVPVSFVSGLGKTINQLLATTGGSLVKGIPAENVDKFFDWASERLGVEKTDSWQEVAQSIDKATKESPVATDWEKA